MNITEHTTVAAIASTLPSSVRVFQRHGIDFCCGGKTPLATVCREHGIPFAELVSAIETSALARSDERDWNAEPLHLLIDHIVATYHDSLRQELPRPESMAAKVARTHGLSAAHLARLEAIVSELSAELRSHMRKEELVLFPAIRTIEEGGAHPGIPIDAPIVVMEHEHDHAAALLSDLRVMTDGYVPPPWACETFRALYDGLSELEAAMHIHVHLENNVLFPRALGLAGIAAQSVSAAVIAGFLAHEPAVIVLSETDTQGAQPSRSRLCQAVLMTAMTLVGWLAPPVPIASAPGLLTSVLVAARPPSPARLRALGWTLVAVSTLTAVIVMTSV